jgi:cytochrome c oxidase subunit IV
MEVNACVFIHILRLDKFLTEVGKNLTLWGLELGVQCNTYRVDWISINKMLNYSTVLCIVIYIAPSFVMINSRQGEIDQKHR